MCGFTDVRRDKKGYYCTVCGTRMKKNYADEMRLCSPLEYKKLLKQCRKQPS